MPSSDLSSLQAEESELNVAETEVRQRKAAPKAQSTNNTGTEKVPLDGAEWNFAFGANLNSKVCEIRRGLKPIEAVPCRVYGYELSFQYRGFPFREPGFGTLVKTDPDVCVHGIAYHLSAADIKQLVATEGGGGRDDVPGYRLVAVKAVSYDGDRVINAKALIATEDIMSTTYVTPSARYKNLIVEGAKEKNLDPNYIAFLESQPVFKPTLWGSMILISAALIISPVLLMMFLNMKFRLHLALPHKVMPYVAAIMWKIFNVLPDSIRGTNEPLSQLVNPGSEWFTKQLKARHSKQK